MSNLPCVVDRIAYFYETIPEGSEPMSEDEMKDVVVRWEDRSSTPSLLILTNDQTQVYQPQRARNRTTTERETEGQAAKQKGRSTVAANGC